MLALKVVLAQVEGRLNKDVLFNMTEYVDFVVEVLLPKLGGANIVLLLLIQLRFRHTKHLKMSV